MLTFVTFLFKTTTMEDNFWTQLLSQPKWRNAEWIMYKHEPNDTLENNKNKGDQSEWKEYRIQFSPTPLPTTNEQDEIELKEKLEKECPQFVIL
jgi:hypothetical protein